ncbi:hypothetical protein JW968_01920 [Candidatus Woesearchaeota archaeon]|nr:hypothetical protein [Candidatus Woesearchaeota archaeon]
MIYLEDKGDELAFSLGQKEDDEREIRDYVKDISGIKPYELCRHIIPAYINNHNSIRLKAKDLALKSSEVKEVLRELMALEIMEETKDMIVARDFISMKKVNIPTLIRKMDNITRGMISDCISMMDRPEILESLTERDKNINRLTYLIFRTIKYGMTNPTAAKSYNLTNDELLKLWLVTDRIEKIADNIKRISRLLAKAELRPETKEQISAICKRMEEFYKDNMKGFYSNDHELLYKCVRTKKDIIMEIDKIIEEPHQKYLPNICENLKINIGQINDIAWHTFGR